MALRNLTPSGFFKLFSEQFPDLLPTPSETLCLEAAINGNRQLEDYRVYGDVAIRRSKLPRYWDALCCIANSFKMSPKTLYAIQVKSSEVNVSPVAEQRVQGKVAVFTARYTIVALADGRVVNVFTKRNFRLEDDCVLVRSPCMQVEGEEMPSVPIVEDLQVTGQMQVAGRYEGGNLQQKRNHSPIQVPPATSSINPNYPNSSSAHRMPPSAPIVQPPLPSQIPAEGQFSALSMGVDLDEGVDVSNIDVEAYPTTSGERRLPIRSLANCSKWNQDQIRNALSLTQKYTHWRRSRGDGNCYYRAVAVGYLEHLCRVSTPPTVFYDFYMKMLKQENVILTQELYSHFRSFVQQLKQLYQYKQSGIALQQLQVFFQDQSFDLGAVAVFRCIVLKTFNDLKTHDNFVPFLIDFPAEATMNQIATMGQEAEGLVFLTMANALNAKIVHVTLSATTCREDVFSPFTPGLKVVLHILLKPGHFDVLYPTAVQRLDRYSYVANTVNEEQSFTLQLLPGLFEHVT